MSLGSNTVGTTPSALKAASSLAQTAAGTTNGAATTSSTPTTTGTDKVAQDRKTIAQNFDAFLSLLTTQLKNQNPLDPLDANQFTQQLVQFSGVEQQLKSNDLLTSISKAIAAGSSSTGKMNPGSAASLIGMQVSVDGGTQTLTKDADGKLSAQFPVQVQANYKNYQVEIKNSKGQTVYQGGWNPTNGNQSFNWNGVRSDGVTTDANDKYTISVVGELADGRKSLMSTMRSGIVTSVNLAGPEETVQFGGMSFPISQIKQIAKAAVATAPAGGASTQTAPTGTTTTGNAGTTNPSAVPSTTQPGAG